MSLVLSCAITINVNADEPPVTNDPLCSKDGIYFLPDPEHCEKFFECVNGDKYLFVCPPNLHFNPSINECDYPVNVGCETSTKINKISRDESESEGTGRPPVLNDPDCPEEGISYLADDENCSIYYECVDGNKYQFTCPAGLHFNLELNTCDYPNHANCKVEKLRRANAGARTEDPPTYEPDFCKKEGVYFIRDGKDCSTYYECVEHFKYTFVCPAGLYFNMEKETCDHRGNVPDCPQE